MTEDHIIEINKQIIVKVDVVSGGPISIYEWKLDEIIQTNNTDTFIIQPNTLIIGIHTIEFRGQNYCGNWSSEFVENINITEETNMTYIQTDPLNINQSTISTSIKLRRTSTVAVTVTDEANVPIVSAQVDIAGISGITDATGVATLLLIPYGTQTVTTTIPL